MERKRHEMLIKKLPGVRALIATSVLNTKIGEVENKIPDVSGLVKKTDYKILDIEKKYFTSEF